MLFSIESIQSIQFNSIYFLKKINPPSQNLMPASMPDNPNKKLVFYLFQKLSFGFSVSEIGNQTFKTKTKQNQRNAQMYQY